MRKLQDEGWVWQGEDDELIEPEGKESPVEPPLPVQKELPTIKIEPPPEKVPDRPRNPSAPVKYCTWCSQDNDIKAVQCECCGNDAFRGRK